MALSASSARRIASSLSNSVMPRPWPALAVDEHQHLRALEPGRCVAGLDLGPNHVDGVVHVGGVAFERRYARVHVASSCRARQRPAYADASAGPDPVDAEFACNR